MIDEPAGWPLPTARQRADGERILLAIAEDADAVVDVLARIDHDGTWDWIARGVDVAGGLADDLLDVVLRSKLLLLADAPDTAGIGFSFGYRAVLGIAEANAAAGASALPHPVYRRYADAIADVLTGSSTRQPANGVHAEIYRNAGHVLRQLSRRQREALAARLARCRAVPSPLSAHDYALYRTDPALIRAAAMEYLLSSRSLTG